MKHTSGTLTTKARIMIPTTSRIGTNRMQTPTQVQQRTITGTPITRETPSANLTLKITIPVTKEITPRRQSTGQANKHYSYADRTHEQGTGVQDTGGTQASITVPRQTEAQGQTSHRTLCQHIQQVLTKES